MEDYRLVNLMVDEKPVHFTSATINLSVRWIGGSGDPGTGHRANRWQGEIVSASYASEIDMATRVHRFRAETVEGETIEAYFTITRSDAEGFEIVGNGNFTVTGKQEMQTPP